MKSFMFSFVLFAMLVTLGCSQGNGIPRPEDTPGWDPVAAYASSIKYETMAIARLAESNPREANAQADAALENFDDSNDMGEYAQTIAEIKEILQAMAAGTGKATGLKDLAAKLPGEMPAQGGNR
jgi:hypothetical protein